MIYLVTGGAGSLGRRLTEFFLNENKSNIIRVFDHSENGLAHMQTRIADPDRRIRYFLGDVRDKDRLRRAMENVEVCVHCAAQKHVDIGEYNPFESVMTNVYGTQNCIDSALEADIAKFLSISSDKACHAISTYGRCKALAESLTIDANNYKGSHRTVFSVARPPNYIESDGSVFEIWRYQKEKDLPLTVTDNRMERYFMSFTEILTFIKKCLDLMRGGEIFVPTNAKKLKIIDLAKGYAMDRERVGKIKIIGMRPGERLIEYLLTDEELAVAEEVDGLWIIKNV